MNRNDQEFMVEKIRTQYMEKTPSELDALRELDAKVKRPANVFAYTFGSISAIVMGSGMSLVMTVMMSMMDGSVSVNPQTGEETVMQGPEKHMAEYRNASP